HDADQVAPGGSHIKQRTLEVGTMLLLRNGAASNGGIFGASFRWNCLCRNLGSAARAPRRNLDITGTIQTRFRAGISPSSGRGAGAIPLHQGAEAPPTGWAGRP